MHHRQYANYAYSNVHTLWMITSIVIKPSFVPGSNIHEIMQAQDWYYT